MQISNIVQNYAPIVYKKQSENLLKQDVSKPSSKITQLEAFKETTLLASVAFPLAMLMYAKAKNPRKGNVDAFVMATTFGVAKSATYSDRLKTQECINNVSIFTFLGTGMMLLYEKLLTSNKSVWERSKYNLLFIACMSLASMAYLGIKKSSNKNNCQNCSDANK